MALIRKEKRQPAASQKIYLVEMYVAGNLTAGSIRVRLCVMRDRVRNVTCGKLQSVIAEVYRRKLDAGKANR